MKRQANVLSALIQNFDTAEKAIEASANSAGSALKENEVWLDSISGKISQFNNATQSMWSNFLDSGLVKDIVEIGTWLIKVIDKVGALNSALVALAGYSMVKNKMGPISFFKGLFEAGKQGLQWTESHLRNLKNITIKTDELHKATATLTQTQLKEKLVSQGLTDKTAEEIVAKTNLGKATDELKASTLDATMREMGYSEEKRKSILQTVFDTQATDENTQANKENAQSNQQAVAAEDKNTQDRKENIATTKQDTQTTQQNTQANKENAQSNNKLGTSFKQLGGKIGSFAKEYAGTLIVIGATLLTAALTKIVDSIVTTFDEMEDEFNESVSELDATNTELRNLESQLDDINKQIDELKANTPLSFTDQEELSRLKAQSAEIQRQIDLAESIKQQQALGVNSDAMKMADKYRDVGVNSGKTTGEATGDAVKVAGGIGIAATGAAASMAAFGTTMSWNVVGWIALAAAAVTAAVGGIAYAIASSEEKVGESLDSMKEQYTKLQSEYEDARAEYMADAGDEKKKKEFEEAQEAFRTYQSNMAGYMTEMDSYYSQIKQNWDQATEDQKKEYIEWQDTMDTWAIQSGGTNAKTNMFARIFGDEAEGNFAKVRDRIAEIKEEIKDAQDSDDETAIEEALAKLESFKIDGLLSDEDVARIREMGAYLYEAEDYFKDVVKAESDFVDFPLEDVAKDINKIADGLDSLKEAFDEVVDKGYLTYKTLLGLQESLGGLLKLNSISETDDKEVLAAWKKYQELMMSGAATTEQMTDATEDLAKAILDKALEDNKLKPETKWEYIVQLQGIGVENAQEYVEELLRKNMVVDLEDDVSKAYENALKNAFDDKTNGYIPDDKFDEIFGNLSAEQLAEIASEYGVVGNVATDVIDEIAEKYGTTADQVQLIIDKLNERKKLENEIAAIEAEKGDYKDFREAWLPKKEHFDKLHKEITSKINSFTYEERIFNVGDWTVNADGSKYQNKTTGAWITKQDYENRRAQNKKYNELLASDAYNEYIKLRDELIALQNSPEGQKWLNPDLTIKAGVDKDFENKINGVKKKIETLAEDIDAMSPELQLKLNLQNFDEGVDKVQDVYSTLKDIATEYNTQGYLSLDNLQALLNMSPEYLACLQMENGQLTINQDALQSMLETKLDDAKATAVQTAITQLNALAERNQAIEISNSAVAANQASIELGTYSGALGTVAQDAIVAAGSVAAFNAALQGAQGNTLVSEDEINQILANFNNSVNLIDSVRSNLSSNFNNVLDPGSKTSPEEVAESKWDQLVSEYENKLALISNERDLIEAEIDRIEAQGGKASEQYYKDLIRNSSEEKDLLVAKKQALEDYLDQYGDTIDPDTWTDYNNEINETAIAIKECTTNLLGFYDALEDISKHYFDQTTDEVSRLGQEIEFVQGLLEDEKLVDEDGALTEAGYTMLGLYVNEMERAAASAAMYDDEINNVSGSWAAYQDLIQNATDINDDGVVDAADLSEESLNNLYDTYGYVITSEEEYKEKTDELIDVKYGEIDAYNAAKDGIVELNEARIDAIKEGIEKEIEAYEDYIDVVKDALDAERDLYDFKKSIQKQTKDIASLERRIAALSGSTNAADVAERRKLEAQLLESKEDLNESYYDHSKDQQSKALDDEAEAFRDSKEKYIEELEKTLEDVGTLITESIMEVMTNADIVLDGLNNIANKYGITLSTELTTPWDNAKNKPAEYWQGAKDAIQDYSDFLTKEELGSNFEKTITGFGEQIKTLVTYWNNVEAAARNAHAEQEREVTVGGNPNLGGGGGGGGYEAPAVTPAPSMHSAGVLMAYKSFCVKGHNGSKTYKTKTIDGTDYLYDDVNDLYYPLSKGTLNRNKEDGQIWESYRFGIGTPRFKYYAKGTTGTSRDQLAIVDELGPELILHADPTTGRLQYLTKGSGVIPTQLTENLMEWGQFTPDSLNLGGGVNVNMINNAVIKPQYDFNFDSLVHVDHCDQGTLKDLEKMVDNKIDKFSRDLNYSIKRFTR